MQPLRKHLLLLLSCIVLLAAIYAALYFPADQSSAIGALFGAAGSILAVIWFSAALYYQSKQLQEQREQFQAEFKHLREEAHRNALTFAKDILSDAEEKSLKQNTRLKSVNDLMSVYLAPDELKTILESTNAEEVRDAVKLWHEREGPAITLMSGIKKAAEIYFTAVGKTDVDYSKQADEFVYVYGPLLWKLPYFESYASVAEILSSIMIRWRPAREAALLAAKVSLLKTAPAGIINKDKILEDVKKHRESRLPIPAIAADL
jgi:hypothetical protein